MLLGSLILSPPPSLALAPPHKNEGVNPQNPNPFRGPPPRVSPTLHLLQLEKVEERGLSLIRVQEIQHN